MGDYSGGHLIIHSTTPEDVPALLTFIDNIGMSVESGEQAPEDSVWIEELYSVFETSISLVHDSHLAEDAPHTAFTLWSEPKHEYLGDVQMHVPGLGAFQGVCDSEGDVQVTGATVKEFLDALPDMVDDIGAEILKLFGQPWLDAIKQLGEQPESVAANYRAAAHLELGVMGIDEDTDRGTNIRFQAVCRAEEGSFACSWASVWHYADQWVDEAQRRNEAADEAHGVHTDPGQLAYEAAERDGQQHLLDEGVDEPTPEKENDSV